MNRTTAGRGRERGRRERQEQGARGGAARAQSWGVGAQGGEARASCPRIGAPVPAPRGSVPKGRRPVLPGESKRPQVPTTCFPDLCGWGADGVQTGRRSD